MICCNYLAVLYCIQTKNMSLCFQVSVCRKFSIRCLGCMLMTHCAIYCTLRPKGPKNIDCNFKVIFVLQLPCTVICESRDLSISAQYTLGTMGWLISCTCTIKYFLTLVEKTLIIVACHLFSPTHGLYSTVNPLPDDKF